MNARMKRILVSVGNILLPLLFALAIGGIALVMIGKNPLEVYWFIVKQSMLNYTGFMNSLGYATPLFMTGIATALSYSANVYNMGIEGQLYVGAWFATFLGFTVTGLPSVLHIIVCIAGGAMMGMLYSLIPALLKAHLRINEVVSTIMLNYVAVIVTQYLTNGPFSDNVGYSATFPIAESAQLPRLDSSCRVTTGLFIALGILAVVWLIMKRTRFGYEINCIGKQKEFSDVMGMKVYRKTIAVFLIGGAIAGIAGATEMMGVNIRFTPGFSTNPGLGWDGQAVCLLANRSPLGILITAFLFGAFKYAGIALQSKMGVPLDLVNIIKSALILFLAARYFSPETHFFKRKRVKASETEEA